MKQTMIIYKHNTPKDYNNYYELCDDKSLFKCMGPSHIIKKMLQKVSSNKTQQQKFHYSTEVNLWMTELSTELNSKSILNTKRTRKILFAIIISIIWSLLVACSSCQCS